MMIYGSGTNQRTIQINAMVDLLPIHLPEILPAVHALTGCDSTSTISTKLTALKSAYSDKGYLLTSFYQ